MRAFAEWELQDALILALPHYNTDWCDNLLKVFDAYKEFIKVVQEKQKVILISPNEEDFNKFFSEFDNVVFHKIDTNDTWIRDYGAIDVANSGRILSYDFKFNAWGEKYKYDLDNKVNSELFKFFRGELKEIDFVLEGGSVDFNGRGTMLTTTRCLLNKNRNPNYKKSDIEKKLMELFGLHTIIWLENGFLMGDDTDSHIDTLARFINPTTIAYVSCNNPKDPHYSELKKMENELKQTNFKLIPIPLPNPHYDGRRRLAATYINFVFINNAIVVPTYNCETDKEAIEIFKNVIKDRVVLSVDASEFIKQNGSLHCLSQNRFAGNR